MADVNGNTITDKLKRLNEERNLVAKIIVASFVALAIPIVSKYAFQSHLPVIFIIILVLIKPILILIGEVSPKDIKRICIILSSVYSVIFALLLTAGILITPANSYRFLFQAMRVNMLNPGRVANIFILFISFCSTTFACTIITHDFFGPVLGVLLVLSALAGLIFQLNLIYIIFLVLVFLCFIYLARENLDKGNRRRSVIFSSIVMVFCFLVGYGLHNTLQIRESKAINTISMTLRGFVSKVFPQVPLMYELPEFGFSFEDEYERKLGSTPILSSIPLFEVEANPDDTLIYLRTRVHSTFINNEWETPEYQHYLEEKKKYKSPLDRKDDETGEETSVIPLSISKEIKEKDEIMITTSGEYYAFLPHTLDTRHFRFERTEPTIVFGDFHKGFYLDEKNRLISNDTYYLRRGTRKKEDPFDKALYLEIPFFISNEIRTLAKTFSSEKNHRRVVEEIKKYLAQNYAYNLETGTPGPKETLLDRFLFKTKEGYSVHFATALIILARLNNIPARYATGFLACIPHPEDGKEVGFRGYKTILNGYSAHVWPEVHYKDTGWTIEEATPAVIPDYYRLTESGLVFDMKISLNPQTQRQLSHIMGQPVVKESIVTTKEFTFHIDPILVLYGAIPVLVFLVLLRYFYFIRYLFVKNKKTMVVLSRKIVKKHKKKGILEPEIIGWIEWGDSIKKAVPKYAKLADAFVLIIIRVYYGAHRVEKRDVKTVYRFFRKVKTKKLRQQPLSDMKAG